MKIILHECIKIMGIFSFIRGKSRVAIGGNDANDANDANNDVVPFFKLIGLKKVLC
jgi:hypothetical protein